MADSELMKNAPKEVNLESTGLSLSLAWVPLQSSRPASLGSIRHLIATPLLRVEAMIPIEYC